MAFNTNACQQSSFDDSFITLTELKRKALENFGQKPLLMRFSGNR